MVDNQEVSFTGEYLSKVEEYRIQDIDFQGNYHKHHIIPRCCGGTDDSKNLVKVSVFHHVMLHKYILESIQGINPIQREKLIYAYNKMNEEYLHKTRIHKKHKKYRNNHSDEIKRELKNQYQKLHKLEYEYKSKHNVDVSLLEDIQKVKQNIRNLYYDLEHNTKKYKYYKK